MAAARAGTCPASGSAASCPARRAGWRPRACGCGAWAKQAPLPQAWGGTCWPRYRQGGRVLLKPTCDVLRVVGDDDVGAGTADARERLEHGGALIEISGGRGGLDHRVLAA